MKRLIRILLVLVILATIIKVVAPDLFRPSTVRAFGDLTVDFHVPAGTPIFSIANMAPGDPPVTKPVDVTNGSSFTRMISVKGIRTGGVGADPKLETVLDLVISDGSIPIYGTGSPTGPKTLKDFFTESLNANGVQLNVINPGGSKTYNFTVTFPSSEGNDFQAKSVIFDLTFGEITGNNVVINEVYYKVDNKHGSDSPDTHKPNNKDDDRGHDDKNKNKEKEDKDKKDKEHEDEKNSNNDEWIELFNPTKHDISLKNWKIIDDSGNPTIIHANKKIKSGGFALLVKNDSTFKKWNAHGAQIIELGNRIGDGLDNTGDHLILKNSGRTEVDRMSWGTDTSGFTPPATNPVVPLGSSTERLTPGFDTNQASDWHTQNPPTPGS